MHFSRTLVLVFAGLGLASPSPSRVSLLRKDARIDPLLKRTHHTAHIDLANFEERADGLSEQSLEKRLNVNICSVDAAHTGVCVAVGAVTAQIAFGIAGLMKSDSNANDCTAHTGSVDGVTWKVYATGRNCDTTAQLETIQGAVTKYLEEQDKNVCGVHCLKLSHGGTYVGYLTIAPAGENLDRYYCGEYQSFGDCVSGGKNDT
ncbi:hypothetical protein MMC22_011186 [Lobaria immixta]|nr:hypothetical protein [Lobaria immixta]